MEPTTTNTVACFLQDLTDRYSVRLPVHEEDNMEDDKPKKLYQRCEEQISVKYHYVWASDKREAIDLFEEHAEVINDAEFEPLDYTGWEVDMCENVEYIENYHGDSILNPEDKDD